MNNLLKVALLENKDKFVNLILENNIDLKAFLNCEMLLNLYSYDGVSFI